LIAIDLIDFFSSAGSRIFEQMMTPTPAPTAPAQMPFTLKLPEGASVIRCPRATGEDKDDVSLPCIGITFMAFCS